MATLAFAARLALIAVFVAAGSSKLLDLGGAREAMADFGVARRIAAVAGPALAFVELIFGLGLTVSDTARMSAGGCVLLLATFTSAIVRSRSRGMAPMCHCFGQIHSAPVSGRTLVRNAAFMTMGVLVLAYDGALSPPRWVSHPAIFFGLAVILPAALAVVSSFRQRPVRPNLRIGAAAPDFHLDRVDGRRGQSSRLFGGARPVLLVFVAPGCGPCHALLPHLASWQREFEDQMTITVISRGGVGANAPLAAEHGLREVLVQRDWEVAQAYSVRGTPSAVLVTATQAIGSAVAVGAPAITDLVQRAATNAAIGLSDKQPAGLLPREISRRHVIRLVFGAAAALGVAPQAVARVSKWTRTALPASSSMRAAGSCPKPYCYKQRSAPQTLSAVGLQLIKCEEGTPFRKGHNATDCVACDRFRKKGRRCPCLRLYDDGAPNCGRGKGFCTIGWGHLVNRDKTRCHGSAAEKPYEKGFNAKRAEAQLMSDIADAESSVNRHVQVELDQPQFDALVDFAFQFGDSKFRKSALVSKLNCGDYDSIPSQLRRWTSGGAPGQLARRENEIDLWIKGRHNKVCAPTEHCDHHTGQCVSVCASGEVVCSGGAAQCCPSGTACTTQGCIAACLSDCDCAGAGEFGLTCCFDHAFSPPGAGICCFEGNVNSCGQ